MIMNKETGGNKTMYKIELTLNQIINHNLKKESTQNQTNKEIKHELKNFKRSRNNYTKRISISGILIYSFSKALGKYK